MMTPEAIKKIFYGRDSELEAEQLPCFIFIRAVKIQQLVTSIKV